jgi:hypothetical protein
MKSLIPCSYIRSVERFPRLALSGTSAKPFHLRMAIPIVAEFANSLRHAATLADEFARKVEIAFRENTERS